MSQVPPETAPLVSSEIPITATEEKVTAARNSVWAAIFLTVTKAVVGLMTGSLGILSEAIHSGLDLLAAIVTWVAVRVSGKPADEDHPYGHGKIESISAMIEIFLLVITCVWIILEAYERLSGKAVHVIEVNFWSFAVMILSIAINVHRARLLFRVAEKYDSQALAADALHFSSDVISSVVVIAGLMFTIWGYPMADPIAALIVSFVIGIASYELGKEALDVLLDKAPNGMTKNIREAVQAISPDLQILSLRARSGGGQDRFADLTIGIPQNMPLEAAHGLSDQVERAIHLTYPTCQVLIHMEPAATSTTDTLTRIRRTALSQAGVVNLHSLELLEDTEYWHVAMHVEVDETMSLAVAHTVSTELEKSIKALDPHIARVVSHIEPAVSTVCKVQDVTSTSPAIIAKVLEIGKRIPDLKDFHEIKIFAAGNRMNLELHVCAEETMPISAAHKNSVALEGLLRKEITQLSSIIIHLEPNNSAP